MLSRWKAWEIKFWNWCKNSGTIVWARVQVAVGVAVAGLLATFSSYDWSQLASLDGPTIFKMLTFAAISGVLTEIIRRKGTRVETVVVQNAATNNVPVEVQQLKRVDPVPPPQG